MGVLGEPLESAQPSPIERGTKLSDRWTVGRRYAVLGDLHLHEGSAPGGPVHIAAWRYQGSEPLPRFISQLETDAETLSTVRHGNLVPTLDAAREHGQLTCTWVIEEPGGTPLSQRLVDHPTLAPDAALHIALQVGNALAELHRAGLVHGDLDPANIYLLGHNDRVRLAWGGLATRIEHAGMDAGRGGARSLAEVAPEALEGGRADPRTDVYALGALLFRMVAGQPPFLVRRGAAAPGVAFSAPLPPLPDHVPADLVALLDDMLQRDPGRRPATVADVLDSLEDLEARNRGLPVPAGVWAPTSSPSEDLTPPTVNRTLTPAMRRDDLDPALSNTPASALRRAPTPDSTGGRSFVPLAVQHRASLEPAPVRTSAPAAGPTWVLMLAGASVMALLVLIGVAVMARVTEPPAPVAPVPAVTTNQPVTSPDPIPAPPAVLTLRTDPPGAEVWEGNQLHGLTPLELLLTGGPADAPRELTLKLKGYASHTVRQPWTDRPVQHSVPLQKVEKRPSRSPQPPAEPSLPVREER